MSMDLEEQYDKIYRYCYFKVRTQDVAEDITQETFLRFFEKYGYCDKEWSLQYLYRIAHNLCIDEYKKPIMEEMMEEKADEGYESKVLNKLLIHNALSRLSDEEKEILLLRYVNEVPIAVICNLFHMSRFALYRKIKKSLRKMRVELGEEELF